MLSRIDSRLIKQQHCISEKPEIATIVNFPLTLKKKTGNVCEKCL